MRVLPGPTKSNTTLAWSPNGRFLAAGGSGDGVMVWDVTAGTPGERILNMGHGGKFMQFCPRTGRLYVAFQTGGFCLWDPATGEQHQHWLRNYFVFYGMTVSPDGRFIAVSAYRNRASLTSNRAVTCYAIKDDGAMTELWSRTEDRWVDAFSFRGDTGELFGLAQPLISNLQFEWRDAGSRDIAGTLRLPLECRRVSKWTLSPDGEQVAWLGEHTLYVQRLHDPSPLQLPPAEGEYRRSLAFHPSGRMLAYTSGKTVRLLDADTLNEIRALEWGTGNARAVAFSPDGLRCAASGEGGRGWVTVFDLE